VDYLEILLLRSWKRFFYFKGGDLGWWWAKGMKDHPWLSLVVITA